MEKSNKFIVKKIKCYELRSEHVNSLYWELKEITMNNKYLCVKTEFIIIVTNITMPMDCICK